MAAKKRLGEMLLEAGIIDATQLQAALGHQRRWGCKLGQALVDLRLATESQVLAALCQKLGYQAVDVSGLQRTANLQEAIRLVPAAVASRWGLLPIAVDAGSLTVAMSDPTNVAVIDEVAFRSGKRVKVVLAADRSITEAVQRFYHGAGDGTQAIELDPSSDVVLEPNAFVARSAPARPPADAPRDPALQEALARLARGDAAAALRPGQLLVAVTRLLLRKGLVTEAELLEELARR